MFRTFWIAVIFLSVAAGGWLRMTRLDVRPVHTDEAVNGLIEGELLETGRYRYNPTHYHGPLLHYLVAPVAWLRGERTTQDLTIETPRLVSAVFGILAILLPLFFVGAIGLRAAALGAMMTAVSPMLVYYSRYSIHEMLFVALGFTFAAANWHWLRNGTARWAMAAGLAAGLMHATKESAAISWLAAFVASIPVLWACDIARRRAMLRRDAHTLGWGLLAALVASAVLYSSFFQNPVGVWDSIRAVFVFEPVPGHEKSWSYYFGAFAPWARGMIGSTEWPVLLAALPVLLCLRGDGERSSCARYLLIFGAALGLVYAMISYKTPWLALGFYQVLAVLAGVGLDWMFRRLPLAIPCAVAAVLAVLLGWNAWKVSVPMASSDRNPYEYSATAPGLGRFSRRIAAMADSHPNLVVGAVGDYWPLPWYLRGIRNAGYWPDAAAAAGSSADIWICSAKQAEALAKSIGPGFHSDFIGLRVDTPVYLFVSDALWPEWKSTSRIP